MAVAPRPSGGGALSPVVNSLTRSEAMGAVGQALSSQAVAQVQLAMQFALSNPRNEDDARSKMVRFTKRYEFAEKGVYSYPRGTTTVRGPSIVLARELAKVWRNIQSGSYTVADDDNSRTLRCWAWDLETNTRQEIDVTFAKLIYRKKQGWIPADERELLELTNRNGSKGQRNCILALMPWDMVQDAVQNCRDVVAAKIKEDPDLFRKNLVRSFADQGVSGSELTAFVGHPLEQFSRSHTEQLGELTAIYRRLRDGDAIWSEIVAEKWGKLGVEGEAPSTATELRKKVAAAAAAVTTEPKAPAADESPPGEAEPPPQGRRKKASE